MDRTKLQKFNTTKIFHANYFECENFPIYGIYRIVGNFCWSKFSRKSRFPSRRNFCGFNFCVQHEHPFIVAGIMGTDDVPWERVGCRLLVWIGTVPSSDRPRLAHKTHAWKFLHVQKFTQKFTKFLQFLFCSSYFHVLVVGCENCENLDLAKISRYTVPYSHVSCQIITWDSPCVCVGVSIVDGYSKDKRLERS